MFNYIFDNTREYNEVLQFVTLFLLIVIGTMIYYMSVNTDNIQKDISNIDFECPECPQCPDLTCENDGTCPDCNCPDPPDCPKNPSCPSCPPCEQTHCPTVDEIVSGIFPGRNTGITTSGRFFDVQANENYELLPSYDFYDATQAFPSDSILDAPSSLVQGNANIPSHQINNSYDNNFVSTLNPTSIDNRMNMAPAGERTGPSSLRFGQGTQRVPLDIVDDNLQRQIRGVSQANQGGNIDEDRIEQEQAERDQLDDDARFNLRYGE